MDFRSRLLATLRRLAPLFEEEGVMVVGSEVPNLLEPGAAASLVVSQDVAVGIPVERHAALKKRLTSLEGLRPSPEEPSVWIADSPELLEVKFFGLDPATRGPGDTYVLDDPDLPLMVFGLLSLLEPGPRVDVGGLAVPVPRPAGLLLDKLATERIGEKGDRDLLVALGLLLVAGPADLAAFEDRYGSLSPELRHTIRSNLATLSLLEPRAAMPDPRPHRELLAALFDRLDRREAAPE
jgi:hypothetical protein